MKRKRSESSDKHELKSSRLKVAAHEATMNSLLPDEMLLRVCECLSPTDLLYFSQTSKKHNSLSLVAFRQWTTSFLASPTSLSWEKSQDEYARMKWLQLHPKSLFKTKDKVVDLLMEKIEPGGQVSSEFPVDRTVARRRLKSQQYLHMEEFVPTFHARRRPIQRHPIICDGWLGLDEVGWSVEYEYRTITLAGATARVKRFYEEMDEEFDFDSESDEGVTDSVQCMTRDSIRVLLRSRPISCRYIYYSHDYRHTDYPAGHSSKIIQFDFGARGVASMDFANLYEVY